MNARFDWTRKLPLLATAAATAGFVLMSLGSGRPASADASAVAFLQPYVTWAQTKPNGPGTYALSVTMVSNEPSSLVSYTEQDVLPLEDHWVNFGRFWWHFLGFYSSQPYGQDGTQYFSDRRFVLNPNSFFNYPFDPNRTDRLGMGLDANFGTLSLTLKSWGNGVLSADLHAANGVLTGVITGGKEPVTVILSVQQRFIGLIK
jgi:hypothetical protein